MENIDPQKAARVWQRVRGEQSQGLDTTALSAMIAGEWTDAATYLLLSRQLSGKDAALIHQLYAQERANLACLKGIYILSTGEQPSIPVQQPSPAPVDALLRRCYSREIRCAALYEEKSTDPEYGPVFAQLAQQERRHCQMLAELIGRLGAAK